MFSGALRMFVFRQQVGFAHSILCVGILGITRSGLVGPKIMSTDLVLTISQTVRVDAFSKYKISSFSDLPRILTRSLVNCLMSIFAFSATYLEITSWHL
mgnify:FL=1